MERQVDGEGWSRWGSWCLYWGVGVCIGELVVAWKSRVEVEEMRKEMTVKFKRIEYFKRVKMFGFEYRPSVPLI